MFWLTKGFCQLLLPKSAINIVFIENKYGLKMFVTALMLQCRLYQTHIYPTNYFH